MPDFLLEPLIVSINKTQNNESLKPILENISYNIKWENFLENLLDNDKQKINEIKEQIKNFKNAKDNDEKIKIKNNLISIYDQLLKESIKNIDKDEISIYKIIFIRFSILTKDLLSEKHIDFFKNNILNKIKSIGNNAPVFYIDEWLKWVNDGKIPPSKVEDPSKNKKSSQNSKLLNLKNIINTEKRSLITNIINRNKLLEVWKIENEKIIKSNIDENIFNKLPPYNLEININQTYENIKNFIVKMQALDRYINNAIKKINKLYLEYLNFEKKFGISIENNTMNYSIINDEIESIKQMIKMSVGPRGNNFPFLKSNYLGTQIITRKILIEKLNHFLYLDQNMFYWKFQGIESYRCPYILLLPCYGETGICWEPIDFSNRATGRGKIAIPMYPSNNTIDRVILTALADFRWQKEKEALGSYWLNEGITGTYYMYHENLKKQKRKGVENIKFNPDLKKSFIEDYILWITFESKGMQKLTKEARQLFWIHLPFPDELKEKLKDRGYHYKILWENDQRKKKSRGY